MDWQRLTNFAPTILRVFPQASTRKSYRPQFLHKDEMFFDCGAQQSAAQWVHRKRGTFEASRAMMAAKLAADRRFSRVNCRGKIGSA
jgi:hypothetical protein